MNTNINIIPFPVTCAVRASIGDVKVNLELGKVSVPVNLHGADGALLKTEYVELAGIEYDLWVKDDYLVSKALAKLGLTPAGAEVKADAKAPEVVVPTPEASQAAQDIVADAVNAAKQPEADPQEKKDGKKK